MAKLKYRIGSHGLQLYFPLLAFCIIIYLMWRSPKKTSTKDRILKSLMSGGLSSITASYAMSQAAHETGNFTSVVYLTNNNCFGMKFPVMRQTTAIGSQLGYANYNSIEDSAADFCLYYQFVGLPTSLQTIDQYVAGLYSKKYFQDTIGNYLAGVKHFYNLYFPT